MGLWAVWISGMRTSLPASSAVLYRTWQSPGKPNLERHELQHLGRTVRSLIAAIGADLSYDGMLPANDQLIDKCLSLGCFKLVDAHLNAEQHTSFEEGVHPDPIPHIPILADNEAQDTDQTKTQDGAPSPPGPNGRSPGDEGSRKLNPGRAAGAPSQKGYRVGKSSYHHHHARQVWDRYQLSP